MRSSILPYGKPSVNNADIQAMVDVLHTRWLTTGPEVEEFEKALSTYTGASHSVVVSSGTAALDLAVASLQLPEGSEIITSPLTFVATVNAIVYNNCVPVFADIKADTFNIDPEQVRKKITAKTRAILCVDFAGHPCMMNELQAIAEEHNLVLITDAAHSLGAEYKNKKVGSLSLLTTFSFHPVKSITSGEGGAITTNDAMLAKRMRILRNHGLDKTFVDREKEKTYGYDLSMLGRNYRLTDFQCALGISQLQKLDSFVNKRNALATLYHQKLKNFSTVRVPVIQPTVRSAWHLYVVLVENRDEVYQKMIERNIGVNVHYKPVYKHSYYRKHFPVNETDFPVTEKVYEKILTLPLFSEMTEEDVNYVVDNLRQVMEGDVV